MSRLIAGPVKELSLKAQDTELAKRSSTAFSHFAGTEGGQLRLRLEDQQTGKEIEATVPRIVVNLLADALTQMGEGKSVTLLPLESELSTQQGAEMLGVSRPYFIKLLEQGEMPYRKVGEQRRVRFRDLMAYITAYQLAATAALDELTVEAQALGLYEG